MDEKELDEIIADLRQGKSNPDAWKAMQKVLTNNGDESWTADKQKELLDAYRDFAYNSPEGKAELQQKLKDSAGQRFTRQYKPFFNAILNGVDIATSLNQINTSNQALKSIIQPSIAQSPGIPNELNTQLQQAQGQGSVEAQRALAPVQAELAQQYANDVNTAKQISGGQGSAYQANVQSASLRRQRAASNLAAIQDSIKARYQGMANQLATAKGQLGQQDFGNRLYGSQLALDQYNRQMAAAGALGQAGRLNLRNSLQGLAGNLPSMFGQIMPTSQPASKPLPTPNMQSGVAPKQDYGPYNNYRDQIEKGLMQNIGRTTYNPDEPSYIPNYIQ